MSIDLSIYLSRHLNIYISIYLNIYVFVYRFKRLSMSDLTQYNRFIPVKTSKPDGDVFPRRTKEKRRAVQL